jgi:hypothetical protein
MAVSPFSIVGWVGAMGVWEELSGLVRIKARDDDMGASGVLVVGVEPQNGVEGFAPPLDFRERGIDPGLWRRVRRQAGCLVSVGIRQAML